MESDYSGSDSSDDESPDRSTGNDEVELPDGLSEVALDTDAVREELQEEEKVTERLQAVEVVNLSQEELLSYYRMLFDSLTIVRYEDVTSQFIDGNTSLICADSLLLSAMRNDYSIKNGGQILHLIYLCERMIQLLQRKSGVFEVVFFDVWKETWVDESLILARSALAAHLKNNTKISVLHFSAAWDPKFIVFVNMRKPNFLLVDLELPSFVSNPQKKMVEVVVHCQVLFSLSLDLPCVSLEKLDLDVSLIQAFVVGKRISMKECKFPALKTIGQGAARSCKSKGKQHCLKEVDGGDIRHVVTVMAASWYLLEEENCSEDWIRVFLLYSAMMEVLPLANRGCPLPHETPSTQLVAFISKIQFYMNLALNEIDGKSCSYDKVSDLWHGNLFVCILRHLKPTTVSSVDLGVHSADVYVRLVEEVSRASARSFSAFPILAKNVTWKDPDAVSEDEETVESGVPPSTAALDRLLPTSCRLSREFCGEFMLEVCRQISQHDARIKEFVTREESYSEVHHWHSFKPLTDEQDRIKDGKVDLSDDWVKKKFERMRNKMAKFMDTYGASIEGRKPISKTILSKSRIKSKTSKEKKLSKRALQISQGNEEVKLKKVPKEKKQSKKALQIIQSNIEAKRKDAKEAEEEMLDKYKEDYKKWKQKGNYLAALESAKILKKSLTSEEGVRRILLYIARCCYLMWNEECRVKKNNTDRNLSFVKEMFLSLREILVRSKNKSLPLSDADKVEIGKWLWYLGFGEVANHWDLPRPSKEDRTFEVGISWIRFQLMHLGPDLVRESGGISDPRVDFVPDPWQKKLFDIIDNRMSAVIVAPTSSGKTYASYYCMETVLKEDDDGLVVYVSPTKALVNQVAATVYSRFKGKRMPEGKSVYGVFTRDYRTDDMDCQILITVPQCLELLLLSPRRQAWVRRLRYVIFDEIHCLAGQAGGISWETCLLMMRCPFLALSATIGNPERFHAWLQDAENFKRERDRLDGCERSSYEVQLVIHTQRHSDLKKYIYAADRSLIHIHPYAHIDEAVIIEHKGIPSHISMAPDETLQLYRAMEVECPEPDYLLPYKPETYFKGKSFVTRNDVRDYEDCLRLIMEKWALHQEEIYNGVITKLKMPLERADISGTNLRFMVSNFLSFIQALKMKQMFPSIFFRYDKADIDYLFELFVEYCSSLEKERAADVSRKPIDGDKRNEKKMKSLYRSSGTATDVLDTATRAGDFSMRRQVRVDNNYLGLLEDSSPGSIRNVGFADGKDVAFVERRLIQAGHKMNDLFPSGLRVGVGKHHAALTSKERSAVEMLFRMKVLNLVLATGTLALGIHMPCKTVVICGDNIYLNTLTYHQMSGRAGRRGFDTEGNVIFYGMTERKMKAVTTGKLPTMIGNFPLTVTLILRLLLLIEDVTEKGIPDETAKNEALSRALTFLNCNLVYQNIPDLKEQIKHFYAFSTQLLMLQGILDDEGKPQSLCGLLTHLHYHEPGNLVLAYLLRSGALRRLCKDAADEARAKDTELNVIVVMSYLFARLPLHRNCLEQEYKNSIVILPPLPEVVAADVEHYNEEVEYMYNHYFRCVANSVARTFGDDDTLPLSNVRFGPSEPLARQAEVSDVESAIVAENVPRTICSRFVALSGQGDSNLYSSSNVISNIRHRVFTDFKVIPFLDCSMQLNGYAWDFYNHGSLPAIIRDNGIRAGDAYSRLNDFKLALRTVVICLEELGVDKLLLDTFSRVSNKFHALFNRAFNIQEKY